MVDNYSCDYEHQYLAVVICAFVEKLRGGLSFAFNDAFLALKRSGLLFMTGSVVPNKFAAFCHSIQPKISGNCFSQSLARIGDT